MTPYQSTKMFEAFRAILASDPEPAWLKDRMAMVCVLRFAGATQAQAAADARELFPEPAKEVTS